MQNLYIEDFENLPQEYKGLPDGKSLRSDLGGDGTPVEDVCHSCIHSYIYTSQTKRTPIRVTQALMFQIVSDFHPHTHLTPIRPSENE